MALGTTSFGMRIIKLSCQAAEVAPSEKVLALAERVGGVKDVESRPTRDRELAT